jgi:hypothetical protein
MQPTLGVQPKPLLEAHLHATQSFSLAALVERLIEAEPGPCWGEHAGNHSGLTGGGTAIALGADRDKQAARIAPVQLGMETKATRKRLAGHGAIEHKRA